MTSNVTLPPIIDGAQVRPPSMGLGAKNMSCFRCRFFRKFGDDALEGACRKASPAIDLSGSVSSPGRAVWPMVFVEDWCGEFEAAD